MQGLLLNHPVLELVRTAESEEIHLILETVYNSKELSTIASTVLVCVDVSTCGVQLAVWSYLPPRSGRALLVQVF